VLTLSQIQNWHNGSFLVLGRVSLEDLGDDLVVFLGELEGDAGIIFGGVAMLVELLVLCIQLGSSYVQLEGHRWRLWCWRRRTDIVVMKLLWLVGTPI